MSFDGILEPADQQVDMVYLVIVLIVDPKINKVLLAINYQEGGQSAKNNWRILDYLMIPWKKTRIPDSKLRIRIAIPANSIYCFLV